MRVVMQDLPLMLFASRFKHICLATDINVEFFSSPFGLCRVAPRYGRQLNLHQGECMEHGEESRYTVTTGEGNPTLFGTYIILYTVGPTPVVINVPGLVWGTCAVRGLVCLLWFISMWTYCTTCLENRPSGSNRRLEVC